MSEPRESDALVRTTLFFSCTFFSQPNTMMLALFLSKKVFATSELLLAMRPTHTLLIFFSLFKTSYYLSRLAADFGCMLEHIANEGLRIF
ncbi:hypothetical protein B0T22DRAFT_461074 [Podospora appendiculata]|uniref:Uncharacterized protein n=1 Tax=Podospora appendiculata TaxID=314037 RepID=A0AAE0XBB7_9PEZI|nr:hypothetical protein B0T22DRAFT_461074 [Podospora appendiculata]